MPPALRPAPAPATWSRAQIGALYELPLMDLLYRAQQVHREHFDPNEVQVSTLLSIKTGGCAEDCGYCSQSAHHDTGVAATKLMPLAQVLDAARAAQASGATRFCMGAAWRSPKERDMPRLLEMVREVRALGLQTCITLGMLTDPQAQQLKQAGLDFYNHNLDTAPEFYGRIVSTRTYQDRLDTLRRVRDAGLKLCCGGILGMGETRAQRVSLIEQLAGLDPYPESVPINQLIRVQGTPLQDAAPVDPIEFVRTVAVARLTMPKARVRLSAGRQQMDDATQALCFLAGANSIFLGERLLTAGNPLAERDRELFRRLGLRASTGACAAQA
ncbi:biotin synthase BioB [Schlegelella sp. S2-27]|uniref:Biotin synthase n=1 Tax=Caldimonas mangrovi TaxID=2944811 RepID=A0ABT0YVE7_9BURK|nr:biotin synthase BioB [Caldimonas mangrovi]MCM5682279.1 biotin synthase BioB [Caldimonas mangrovi]